MAVTLSRVGNMVFETGGECHTTKTPVGPAPLNGYSVPGCLEIVYGKTSVLVGKE